MTRVGLERSKQMESKKKSFVTFIEKWNAEEQKWESVCAWVCVCVRCGHVQEQHLPVSVVNLFLGSSVWPWCEPRTAHHNLLPPCWVSNSKTVHSLHHTNTNQGLFNNTSTAAIVCNWRRPLDSFQIGMLNQTERSLTYDLRKRAVLPNDQLFNVVGVFIVLNIWKFSSGIWPEERKRRRLMTWMQNKCVILKQSVSGWLLIQLGLFKKE